MSLTNTGKAIGKVSSLLVNLLGKTKQNVTVGRPEPGQNRAVQNPRLNIFLYEVTYDPSLKNFSLDEGQPAPLWLVLKYILTAFDKEGESDTPEAHEFLGEGLRLLHEFAFLSLDLALLSADPAVAEEMQAALRDNPEPLKVTFDATPSDLLSKLMQGSDEKYRCSAGFEVRPVMIASGQPPAYNLLVGVDYTQSPAAQIGERGVGVEVFPSMGTRITGIIPAHFDAGASVAVSGSDLNLPELKVRFGPVEINPADRRAERLTFIVDQALATSGDISAGSHPLAVRCRLPNGRLRTSNLLVGSLLPTLTGAATDSLARLVPTDPLSKVYGNIDLTGVLLGGAEDDVYVALYQEGRVVRLFDEFTVKPPPPPPPPVPPQTQMRLMIKNDPSLAVPPGKYRVILRVNGQQAKNSPEIELKVP